MQEKKTVFDALADYVCSRGSVFCDRRLKTMNDLKEKCGDSFDTVPFINSRTREFVYGADLRDCQTGCDIYEKLGYFDAAKFKCGCKQFDEQLQFVNEEDEPLSNVDYCLTRADGMKVKGTTDNEGKTKRIKNTQQEMAIEKVEFFASEKTQPLCPQNRIPPGTLIASLELSDVKTTMTDVGSSVRKITVQGESRPMTSGEIDMTKLVFKDSIDYSKVKVHKKKWWLTFGLQPDDCAMTLGNEMYFSPAIEGFKEDFSIEDNRNKRWFIHEVVHVWQHQLGYSLTWAGFLTAISGGYANNSAYKYDPLQDKYKRLSDFNFEQQGDMIADYFTVKYLKDPSYESKLLFLEGILKDFLRRPGNAALLPK